MYVIFTTCPIVMRVPVRSVREKVKQQDLNKIIFYSLYTRKSTFKKINTPGNRRFFLSCPYISNVLLATLRQLVATRLHTKSC